MNIKRRAGVVSVAVLGKIFILHCITILVIYIKRRRGYRKRERETSVWINIKQGFKVLLAFLPLQSYIHTIHFV